MITLPMSFRAIPVVQKVEHIGPAVTELGLQAPFLQEKFHYFDDVKRLIDLTWEDHHERRKHEIVI